MSNAKQLKALAAKVGDALAGDLSEFGKDASMLAHRAIAQQVLVLTSALAGNDTTMAEAALKATYQNLAVASSAKAAKATNKAFKAFVVQAVGVAFDAAGLPTAPRAPRAAPKPTDP